jgi:hypothetical protein
MKRLIFASALLLSSFVTSCSRPTSDAGRLVDRAPVQPRIILDTVETDERGLISIQFTDAAGKHWGYDYLTLAEFNEFVNNGRVAEK